MVIRFLKKSFWLLILLPVPIMIMNFIADPVQFYRRSTFYEPAYYKEQRFQNPGLAKHYEYNAAIIGTSMSENFLAQEFDTSFHCRTLKLTISGSSLHEQALLLELVLRRKPKIVFWGIESYTLNSQAGKVAANNNFPGYLYDDSHLNDVLYLTNPTLSRRSFAILTGTIWRNYHDPDEIGRWGFNDSEFVKDSVLAFEVDLFKRRKAEGFMGIETGNPVEVGKENIHKNLVEVIRRYPNTTFYIFFTPPSILMQISKYREKELTKNLELKKYLVNEVQAFNNVKCFDFEHDSAIITNIDLYKDMVHYKPVINSYMIKSMKNDAYRVNDTTIDKVNASLYKLVEESVDRH